MVKRDLAMLAVIGIFWLGLWAIVSPRISFDVMLALFLAFALGLVVARLA